MQSPPVSNSLTLWEIAHRWHGLDARDARDAVPIEVVDTLRWLVDRFGVESFFGREVVDRGGWIRDPDDGISEILYRLHTGVPDGALFDRLTVRADVVYELCIEDGVTPPSFWFPEHAESPAGGLAPRGSQEDRIRCRTLAAVLWEDDPTLTAVQVIEHPWIKRHGNGALYKNATIRRWIKDLNPDRSPGRRPKAEK